ncbi:cobalamin-dependent protein, partial [Candidatus Omnitrophota bacterium]
MPEVLTKQFKVLFLYPNTMMSLLLPLHISIMSACLKKKGFQVALFDTTYYRTEEKSFDEKKVELLQVKRFTIEDGGYEESDIYKDLNELVEDYKPNLIAISLVEDTHRLGVSLLKSIEKYDIPVIAGGNGINFKADEVIKEKQFDMLCLGEGEEVLVELCEAMYEGKDYSGIKN